MDADERARAEGVKSAARSYRESFTSSADPLTKVFKVFSDPGEAVPGAAGPSGSRLAPRGFTGGDDRR